MHNDDFTPFEPAQAITPAEKEKAIAFLRPLEAKMKYDSVRGWFMLKDIDSDLQFQVIDTLKKLGGYGISSLSDPSTGKSSITTVSKEESAEVVKTLRDAGFNFPGVKDIPLSEKGVG